MKKYLFVVLMSLVISGCSAPAAYKEVFNGAPSYNQKDFAVSADKLYLAAVKAVYAHNFTIENEDATKQTITAKRVSQKGKRNTTILLHAKIMSGGEGSSTLFFNAVEITERVFIADRTRFFLWIIPLPGGGGKEATRVKEGEKIIEDKEFYKNFFSAVEKSIALGS